MVRVRKVVKNSVQPEQIQPNSTRVIWGQDNKIGHNRNSCKGKWTKDVQQILQLPERGNYWQMAGIEPLEINTNPSPPRFHYIQPVSEHEYIDYNVVDTKF